MTKLTKAQLAEREKYADRLSVLLSDIVRTAMDCDPEATDDDGERFTDTTKELIVVSVEQAVYKALRRWL